MPSSCDMLPDGPDEILNQLTPEQLQFLRRHNIPIAKVFDASGYSQPEWREQISLHELVVAINVSPCKKGAAQNAHEWRTLRPMQTREFRLPRRYRQEAYVYILGSKRQQILKVGYSESPHSRAEHLSVLRYGAATDWKLLFYVRCKRAGTIEHSLLSKHRDASVFGEYWKDRRYQECFELLRCDFKTLVDSLSRILDEATMNNAWQANGINNDYSFGT